MAKKDEIEYISNLSSMGGKSVEDVIWYHKNKPWSDEGRARYLVDIAQILQLLPPPPAKLLDVGMGSGWTSKIFAECGYTVLGMDIAPDMVAMARDVCAGVENVEFAVADFENFSFGEFDCAVIYDSLHHADSPEKTIKSVYLNLKKEGVLITAEPGRGHKIASRKISRLYGTTENDMTPRFQKKMMVSAGFCSVITYSRLRMLPFFNSSSDALRRLHAWLYSLPLFGLMFGSSRIVVAKK